MRQALTALAAAKNTADTRSASIDVTQSALDLQLRYRPVPEVDLARFRLWLTRLLIDLEAKDDNSVNGDSFTLEYIRDRVIHSLRVPDADRLNVGLEKLQNAVQDGEPDIAANAAAKLRADVADMTVVPGPPD
jgi:hypothetical protein